MRLVHRHTQSPVESRPFCEELTSKNYPACRSRNKNARRVYPLLRVSIQTPQASLSTRNQPTLSERFTNPTSSSPRIFPARGEFALVVQDIGGIPWRTLHSVVRPCSTTYPLQTLRVSFQIQGNPPLPTCRSCLYPSADSAVRRVSINLSKSIFLPTSTSTRNRDAPNLITGRQSQELLPIATRRFQRRTLTMLTVEKLSVPEPAEKKRREERTRRSVSGRQKRKRS